MRKQQRETGAILKNRPVRRRFQPLRGRFVAGIPWGLCPTARRKAREKYSGSSNPTEAATALMAACLAQQLGGPLDAVADEVGAGRAAEPA